MSRVVSSQPTKVGRNVFELDSERGESRYKTPCQRCMRDVKCYDWFGGTLCQCLCCGCCERPIETMEKLRVEVTEGGANPGGKYITMRIPKEMIKFSLCRAMRNFSNRMCTCWWSGCVSDVCPCCFNQTGELDYSFLASDISAVESNDKSVTCKKPCDPYCCCCWCFPPEEEHELAVYLNSDAGGAANPYTELQWNGKQKPTLREGFENCDQPKGAAATLRTVLMHAKIQGGAKIQGV